MMRRLAERPGLVFALVFAWKVALLLFTAQPVPANDSFFYDGPVVNLLLHHQYTNPSLALTLPVSGNEVFCAYPPGYQAVLFAWMSAFGTSAVAAMALHLVLFGLYLLVLLGIFRRLKTPPVCVNLAGLFLFVITFHDRPDTLAQWLGMFAILAWLCARETPVRAFGGLWDWLVTALVVLTFCTSLQIGALYLCWVWLLALGTVFIRREKIAWLPLLGTVLIPAALIALAKFDYPHLWAGFMEHARQTPSLTSLRAPSLVEVVKVLRTVPGVLAVVVLTPVYWLRMKPPVEPQSSLVAQVGLTALLAAGAIVAGCMFFMTANLVHMAGYFQPLVVGCFFAFFAPTFKRPRMQTVHALLFLCLALVGSIRAIGMTTWGVACAKDVGYSQAMNLVRPELPRSGTAVLSAAYLYEAARHDEFKWIHSDWLGRMERGQDFSYTDALIRLKPGRLILTQFDYYRRYDTVIEELKARPDLVEIQVLNTARMRAPDSFPSLQKVVQHVSWAPVIVTLSWKEPRP